MGSYNIRKPKSNPAAAKPLPRAVVPARLERAPNAAANHAAQAEIPGKTRRHPRRGFAMSTHSPQEFLAKFGLHLPSTAPGRYYVTCPKCSANRSTKAHQEAKCLGITIDDKGTRWGCSHCGLTGPPRGNGQGGDIVATYDFRDEAGELLFQKLRKTPKRFSLRRPDRHGGWIWSVKDVRKVIYRLPEVIEAIASEHAVLCVEGEKDADNLWSLGVPATCSPDGASEPDKKPKWRKEYSEQLRGADIVIIPDNDPSGYAHAEITAKMSFGIAKRVRYLDLPKHWPECPKGGDISDWLAAGHTREQLDVLIEAAPLWEGEADSTKANGPEADKKAEARIAQLAEMNEFAFQRKRKEAANELGMPVAALEKLVRQCRAKQEDTTALPHWAVEKCAEVVSGSVLLDSIRDVLRRYIVLPPHAAEAIALWVLHTWTFDACDSSPFLAFVSPTKRCGKTSLLILIYWLTPRSELASNISPSAIFRYIEEVQPTLLIDEADSFVRDNDELRGILNSGHTKTAAHVIRNVEVNGEHKPRRFSTWAPKAIATIKGLADTLEDRSIIITMRRKSRDEQVERRRGGDKEEFSALRSKALRWATDNLRALKKADPVTPEQLNDRAADNWRPLLAIADLAGGEWPARARMAALALPGEDTNSEDIGVRLLEDIHVMFEPGIDVLLSRQIVENLCADPEKPWADYNRGRPITQKQAARLLGAFQIFSGTVHPPGLSHGRGYKREQFDDAVRRYAATPLGQENPLSKCASVQVAAAQRLPIDFRSVQVVGSHTSENGTLSYSHADLHTCTLRNGEDGASGVVGDPSDGETFLGPPGDNPADFEYPELPASLDRRGRA
jgi:hypothetical protein